MNKNKEKGIRRQTLKDKIILLLTERKDLTRFDLAEMLNKTPLEVSIAISSLRKDGFKIWPSKGPGTPYKIARSANDAIKYIAWRRTRFLDVSRRMIMTESELGEQFKELAKSHDELLKLLAQNDYELPESTPKRLKTGQKSA